MKIALIQMTSVLDPGQNLSRLRPFFKKARNEGAFGVCLPECFYSLGDGLAPVPFLVAPGNEHYIHIQNLAKDYNLALIGGTAATREDLGIVNRAYFFDSEGVDLGHYDKVHLFACNLKEQERKTVLDEAEIYQAGKEEYKIFTLGGWNFAPSICFDLRFPEDLREKRRRGAEVMLFPAAFTVPTGRAHWKTLLRSRAIENQCYVLAAAQWGRHNDRIETYGHTLAIDPWGEVLAEIGEGEGMIMVNLERELLNEVRGRLKVF